MTATYYHQGRGHSVRGQWARDAGACAWSKLPARMRRGITSSEAVELGISDEWHHAGKYANQVYVYHPEAVDAYWAVLDAVGVSAKDAVTALRDTHAAVMGRITGDSAARVWEIVGVINKARDASEDMRQELDR